MTATTTVAEHPTAATIASMSRRAPTEGQRLVLALVSFAVLIPLCALTAALVAPLTDSLPAWPGALITTCAQMVVCAAVVIAGGRLIRR